MTFGNGIASVLHVVAAVTSVVEAVAVTRIEVFLLSMMYNAGKVTQKHVL